MVGSIDTVALERILIDFDPQPGFFRNPRVTAKHRYALFQ